MATVTIKNIPDELYARLRASANANRRSINSEIIVCIERGVSTHRVLPEVMIARARDLRRLTANSPITDAQFDQAKTAGRL